MRYSCFGSVKAGFYKARYKQDAHATPGESLHVSLTESALRLGTADLLQSPVRTCCRTVVSVGFCVLITDLPDPPSPLVDWRPVLKT